MGSRTNWLLLVGALASVLFLDSTVAKERTWTDSTGKFSVTAELVSATEDEVVLRRADGTEITVPRQRLSDADRAYLAKRPSTDDAGLEKARGAITEIAELFYADLRTDEREQARQSLTDTAQEAMKSGKSPLALLPQPAEGDKAIRPGRVRLDDNLAEIEVRVRAGGRSHKTKMHLRYEQDQWRVFAMSATYPDGEKSINLEVAVQPERKENPLEALLGQTLDLEGYTVDGGRLDMSRFDGKVVLVDYWATWCGPCRKEIPNIQENWEQYHDDGFEVIAISVDRDMQALQKFLTAEMPPWTVVADNAPENRNSMGAKYGIRGIPAFILIGRDGKVASVNCRGKRLGKQLASLLDGGDDKHSQSSYKLRENSPLAGEFYAERGF